LFATTAEAKRGRGTPWVKGDGRSRRRRIVAGGESLLSSAGGALLAQTTVVSGLDRALQQQFAPWKACRATRDPGKVVLDLAVAVALGGECAGRLPGGLCGRAGRRASCSGTSPRIRRCPA
jgi:hypothetical protein